MILAWDNKWDAAALTVGSQIGTLPGTNTQQPHLSRKWQTVAAVKSSNIVADLGSAMSCSMLAVLGTNLSKNATARLRGSPSSAAATSDVTFDSGVLNAAKAIALFLPGTAGNYASTPDAPWNSQLGDIEIKVKAQLTHWTPAPNQALIAKDNVANNRSWHLYVRGAGFNTLVFEYSNDGAALRSAESTVATGIADGSTKWLKVTYDSVGGTAKFYTSDDYDPATDAGTWTQLGANVAITAGAIFDGTAPITVGALGSGASSVNGRIYYAEVRNGIGGQVMLRFDPNTDADAGVTTWTSSKTREAWTLSQSGVGSAQLQAFNHANLKTGFPALYKTLTRGRLSLPGTAGNYASTPDTAANSITGDLDVRVKVSFTSWRPAAGSTYALIAKDNVANNRSWHVFLRESPFYTLVFEYTPDGATLRAAESTVATGLADGVTKWIRVTYNSATGGTSFYTSDDYDPNTGVGTWVQLGATVAITAGAIFDGTAPITVGAYADGSKPVNGTIYYAEVRNGVDGTNGVDSTRACVFDPARAAASGATTLSSLTGETWTINQAGGPKAELLLDTDITARYWRLDLTDNTVSSNLQVGRVFLGPSWQPTASAGQGMLWGWAVTPKDPSRIAKSRGGQVFADILPQTRVLDFTLSYLSEAQIYDNAFAMARAQGRVKDVLAIPFEGGSYASQQAVWGLVQASEPVVNETVRVFRQKFQIEERL